MHVKSKFEWITKYRFPKLLPVTPLGPIEWLGACSNKNIAHG
jgi:hypothetical protein